jgi:CRISPR-associated protein (TIGR02710 family)
VKSAYLEWNMPSKLYIDFTGGTKAMSAAASMAGAVIDIQLIYIGTNDYLVDFRKPRPGSETLYYISNPYEVFGDFEIEKALHLFEQYNYAGAKERLSVLKEKVPDPIIRQQLDFIYYLAGMYEYWDSLDFSKAYHASDYLIRMLERDKKLNPQYILMDYLDILKQQRQVLYPLSKIREQMKEKGAVEVFQDVEYIVPLMFTMLQNSFIREKQEKYDSATLLLYRLLEMIEQRRLSLYRIDVSKADFLEIKYPLERFTELKGKTKEQCLEWYTKEMSFMKQKIFGKPGGKYLPEQISLLDGYIHLAVLRDDIMTGEEKEPVVMLKRLRSAVYLRNNSIFAHGLSPVSTLDFQKFKDYVVNLFQKFCRIEQIDFQAYMKKMEYIDPAKSKYNSIGIKRTKH